MTIQRIRLYVVRHGHVDYFDAQQKPINPKYAALSAEGEQQIQMLAQQLAVIAMDQVYSSTMPRSIQTAQILAAKQRHQDIISCDEIREIKSGRLKEISVEQASVVIKQAYSPYRLGLTGFLQGESWQDFEPRVRLWFEQMLLQQAQAGAAEQEKHILVSAHDAVNRVILNWAQGLDQHDFQAVEQHYAALNMIDCYIENNQIVERRILMQNYTAHNIFKIKQSENALDHVYQLFMQTNGFKGETV